MVGSAAASLGTEIVCRFALGFFAVPTAGMSEVLGVLTRRVVNAAEAGGDRRVPTGLLNMFNFRRTLLP
jgi:hypothetical protein